MKIVEPSVELWKQGENKISHVAKCARVCYGKESGNNVALYENLEKSKHWSMFRHETYYAAVPVDGFSSRVYDALSGYFHNPYIKYFTYKDYCYIITNGNFLRDIEKVNPVLYKYIKNYQISTDEAEQIEPLWRDFARYTFCVTTQISTSRELNRVSPNSIAEQSTRYVYEDGSLCRPHWMEEKDAEHFNANMLAIIGDYGTVEYIDNCVQAFNTYTNLIKLCDFSRQDARGVLPLDTATKCVYTYSIKEWRNIIDLRYYGTTGKPHPNAKIIAGMIKDELVQLGYEFR